MYTPSLLNLSTNPHPTPLSHLRALSLALCAIYSSSQLTILQMICIYAIPTPQIHFTVLFPCPCVHSLHLHLYSCCANYLC